MSDNLRRYCAIHSALLQLYPTEPTGNLAQHLKTLAALVCGIVGSRRTHLAAVAGKAPDRSKRESRVKRLARFLQNPKVTHEDFFVPYARALVGSLPPGPLVLVMDGSQVEGFIGVALVHGAHGQRPLRMSDPAREHCPCAGRSSPPRRGTSPSGGIKNCSRR